MQALPRYPNIYPNGLVGTASTAGTGTLPTMDFGAGSDETHKHALRSALRTDMDGRIAHDPALPNISVDSAQHLFTVWSGTW